MFLLIFISYMFVNEGEVVNEKKIILLKFIFFNNRMNF